MHEELHVHQVDFRHATQRQVALAHGVDERTVRRWSDLGMPRNKDGSYDLAVTVRWRVLHTDTRGRVVADTWH